MIAFIDLKKHFQLLDALLKLLESAQNSHNGHE